MKAPFSLIQVFDDPARGLLGNTAAVIMLQAALNDSKMQQIAADLNQPATAFLWPAEAENDYYVRWFAPDSEIGLCGHGSLAAIACLDKEEVILHYRQGIIKGRQLDSALCSISLDAIENKGKAVPPAVLEPGLGIVVQDYYLTDNKQIVVVESEEALKYMRPDFALLRESEVFGYTITAPGDEVDFVSRTLVPHVQQLEDPATGSSHAALTPFWAKRLNKTKMTAHQLSKRGGKFICELDKEQVILTGHYTRLAEGTLV